MYVALDQQQADTLRDILQQQLRQLRTETARADSHDFREMLYQREAVIEQVLTKLSEGGRVIS